ncbi:MAG: hypothetical protein O2887_15665 [Bacteroidetes bacterium]|nr:hypothetical protein [Bacteroidota bacterium]MDA1121900.1 hypothetical protein [Bacteroidota bacterium]
MKAVTINHAGKIILFILTLSVFQLKAQNHFDEFIEAGEVDANIIYKAYSDPILQGLNYGFGRGWYNTAKSHEKFGVDFSINVVIAYVPEKDHFYSTADLTQQFIQNGGNTRFVGSTSKYPTMVGPESPQPVFEVYNPEFDTYEQITGPAGFSFTNSIVKQAVPVVIPQFGIGLFKNTDIKLRFLPKVGSSDVKLNMFGIGVMHDIKQWIPGNSVIPIDIALLVGYTHFGLDVLKIEDDNDEGHFKLNSVTYQLLVSKTLKVITFYGGFGYIDGYSKVNIKGEYDVAASLTPIIDPVNFKSKSTGMNGALGVRLAIKVLTLHCDYTIQDYNALSFGFGFSIR